MDLYLISRMLLEKGDLVAMETLSYTPAQDLFKGPARPWYLFRWIEMAYFRCLYFRSLTPLFNSLAYYTTAQLLMIIALFVPPSFLSF